MKLARRALMIAVAFLMPACQGKVNEVTAPLAPPVAKAVAWGPARTWTPTVTRTPTTTPTPNLTPPLTPTSTPTPAPLDLTGWWGGPFTYENCVNSVTVHLSQIRSEIYGLYWTICFDPGEPPLPAEIIGTLQGNSLALILWMGDFLIAHLDGTASPTTIDVWNEAQSIGLSLTRLSP